jgi:predicted PurR-regulated permease PerM
LQHKLTDDLVRTISELGIVGIITVLVTLVLAVFWLLLPFIVCAVQKSTSNCRRELRALNNKLEQILSKIEVASKASTDVSPLDTTHSTTTNGQVP